MNVSLEVARKIEAETRKQSNVAEWKVQRSKRITSTFTKDVTTAIRKGGDARRAKLANQICKPTDLSRLAAIRRGHDLEPVAAEIFCDEMKRVGFSTICVSVGLVASPANSWTAASPDRFLELTAKDVDDLLNVLCWKSRPQEKAAVTKWIT